MLRQFCRSEQGNYAVITAIAMVPLLAGVGGAVDYAITTHEASNLQNALDSAALVIGTKYFDGMSKSELQEIGHEYFQANLRLFDKQSTTMEYDDWKGSFDAEASGSEASYLISVSANALHPGFIGGFDWPLTRTSVASVSAGDPACVLALNEHASKAIEVQGSTNVSMVGCIIASNSNASDSLYRGGSAKLTAKCAIAVGDILGLSDSSTKLECPAPMPKQYPSFDPLAGVEPPPYGSCKSIKGGKITALEPGTYCNKTISGTVTLEPGVYIFKGGKINLGGNGSLTGVGVTIFLMEDAELSINANQLASLSPPATGPYAGITIYQAPGNTKDLTLNGGAGSSINGFVYAPDARITYTGNSDTGSDACLRIVGDTIKMIGNSTVKSDCTDELGGRKMYAGRVVRLVR